MVRSRFQEWAAFSDTTQNTFMKISFEYTNTRSGVLLGHLLCSEYVIACASTTDMAILCKKMMMEIDSHGVAYFILYKYKLKTSKQSHQ